MEVHHHPHTEKKRFKEYFLEFIMIFLAVTLGFFAESIRENISDRSKEKEYVAGMLQDLKDDTTSISKFVQISSTLFKMLDTMLADLKSENPDPGIINDALSQHFWAYGVFSYNNRTVQQLKNSGNFRLLQNRAVADSILQYDNLMNSLILAQYTDLKNTMYAYKDAEAKIIPYKQMKPAGNTATFFQDTAIFSHENKISFISSDKELISLYYNKLFIHAALAHLFVENLQDAKLSAIRLMSVINQQYHLENE